MQSVLPNQYTLSQPTSYSTFEADDQYKRAYQEPIAGQTNGHSGVYLNREPRCNVESHPSGSTVIQTETPTKHQGGFLGKVENLKLRAGEHMGIGTDSATRWSLYQFNEPLFGEFRAKLVNGTHGFSKGFLFVSAGHLCFSSFTDAQNRAVKVAIPLRNIVKIGLAQRLRNVAGSGVVLTPLSSLSMKANALQVFTKDGVLHQFFGFRKKTEQMFNTLSHVWKASSVNGTGFETSEATASVNAYEQALLTSGFNRGNAGGFSSSSTFPVSQSNQSALPSQFTSGQTSLSQQQNLYAQQPLAQNVEVRHVNPSGFSNYETKQELASNYSNNGASSIVPPTNYRSM